MGPEIARPHLRGRLTSNQIVGVEVCNANQGDLCAIGEADDSAAADNSRVGKNLGRAAITQEAQMILGGIEVADDIIAATQRTARREGEQVGAAAAIHRLVARAAK